MRLEGDWEEWLQYGADVEGMVERMRGASNIAFVLMICNRRVIILLVKPEAQ